MIVDSSVIVALVLAEPAAEKLLAKMRSAETLGIGAPALSETLIVLAHRLHGDPLSLLSELLREFGIGVIPFDEEHARVALDAFVRFGKGRHPAALNFGDCLTYATASVANQPLLFVGDDFSKTDLVAA